MLGRVAKTEVKDGRKVLSDFSEMLEDQAVYFTLEACDFVRATRE